MVNTTIFQTRRQPPPPTQAESEATAKRKRKRSSTITSPENNSPSSSPPQGQQLPQSPPQSPTRNPTPILTHLTRAQLSQFALAGHQPNDPIPPSPFPDAPPHQNPDGPNILAQAKTATLALQPPLHNIWTGTGGHAKAQHLAVMTTVLHSALLRGDYERAGRAWALLLRASPDGVDLRAFGRWGIGAEVLLRRGKTRQKTSGRSGGDEETVVGDGDVEMRDDGDDEAAEKETEDVDGGDVIPEANLEAAKQFYEGQIRRHPPKRNTPLNLVPMIPNFYPAFFSVWIYQITQRSRLATAKLARKAAIETRSRAASPASLRSSSLFVSNRRGSIDRDAEEIDGAEAIRERELASARELAERFDTELDNAPYDNSVEMLRLRSMVAQWIADLVDAPVDKIDDDLFSMGGLSLEDGIDSNATPGRSNERHQALKTAKEMLARAERAAQG
ncbi:hypothetical protein BT63DRAFT_131248 [Microthyrium microscopicum]|uniref:Uncharacterized protein n=1 Tax=Microthyrium microscopicum TaxID=703497 RepID=A0A6A6UNW2_9PEZI|nr:hypothetical protein BT63DRAFT_131248 [Microthyrium microscopicum]